MKELAASSFLKRCSNCGRSFRDVPDYMAQASSVPGGSGLKQARDDDGSISVELFRNCPCGSILMDFFSDRRDTSAFGQEQREGRSDFLGQLRATNKD